MFRRRQGGFTVIEMLTVIAIIGVLAAIIFPVMASAKKKAKQTQCISNLHQIHVAVKAFQLDEHRYPDFIAGPVVWRNNQGVIGPEYNSGQFISLDNTTGVIFGRSMSLFPEYIKSVSDLKCPLANMNADRIEYSPSNPAHIVQDPMFSAGLRSWDDNGTPKPYFVYKFSSYDYQKPKPLNQDEIHYSIKWIDPQNLNDPDIERQLVWQSPPTDTTVITWCSYHRDFSGANVSDSSMDLVLYLDGHVKPTITKTTLDYDPVNGVQVPLQWVHAWRVKPGQ